MKKLLSFILLVFISSSFAIAQTDKEEIDMYQAMFGLEKKAIAADFFKLDKDDPFWLLYDEYETKRKELGFERINLMREFLANYDSFNEENATNIIKKAISQKRDIDKLIEIYYWKTHKMAGAKVAAQFWQIENFFLAATRMEVFETLPFIVNMEEVNED